MRFCTLRAFFLRAIERPFAWGSLAWGCVERPSCSDAPKTVASGGFRFLEAQSRPDGARAFFRFPDFLNFYRGSLATELAFFGSRANTARSWALPAVGIGFSRCALDWPAVPPCRRECAVVPAPGRETPRTYRCKTKEYGVSSNPCCFHGGPRRVESRAHNAIGLTTIMWEGGVTRLILKVTPVVGRRPADPSDPFEVAFE